MQTPSPIIIAGCGYLGQALARLALAEGRNVLGICKHASSAEQLTASGIPARAADLSDAAAVKSVAAELPGDALVVHCAASGRGGGADAYRAVYLHGMHNLLTAFPAAGRVLFTSSTSVYSQTDGAWVTEDSPALPDREIGRILRQTENGTLAAGGCVVRLAGIYGPGRSVLLKNFLTEQSVMDVRTEAPATPDGRWINQIHCDDATRAILFLLTEVPEVLFLGGLYNVADSTPMLQRTIYEELTKRFARPMPPEAPPDAGRKRGWTHKRVDASRLRAAGWRPLYASWFQALDEDPAFLPSVLAQGV